MKQATTISKFSLSVLALGLLAFPSAGFAAPASEADDTQKAKPMVLKNPVDTTPIRTASIEIAPKTPTLQDVESQANNLRNLFEAAGRNGLVDLKNPPQTKAEMEAVAKAKAEAARPVSDCMSMAPLFDGGQGGFATGMFTELRVDWPENAALAGTLADLIDPGYDGRALPMDLTRAGDCGPSFLPWQALADPGRVLGAKDESVLTGALADMDENLRRQLGMQIAIRAGLADNLRLSRRISDTLIDAQLHGEPRHDRDPEHILLDAILKMSKDPIGARARLSWIAERDGPEQMVALDLMRTIDAAPAARSELQRLSESPDTYVRLNAEQRLLSAAIDDADIGYVAELVTKANNLADDDDARARLAVRLEEAIEANDPIKAVQAMNLIDRLLAKGVEFSPELKVKADARLAAMTTDALSVEATGFTSSLPEAIAPGPLNGPDLTDYLGTLNSDMDTYREVLSRG